MMISNDLSDYERIRLENIQRNASFLQSLGFDIHHTTNISATVHKVKKDMKKDRQEKKRKRDVVSSVSGASSASSVSIAVNSALPTRSSRRLQLIQEIDKEEQQNSNKSDEDDSDDESNEGVDYNSMPQSSEDLDDYEFEVYAYLKAWRLGRCKELDIEPYKICQNRTLAEFIRLRRNNPFWAKAAFLENLQDVETDNNIDSNTDSNTDNNQRINNREKDLLQCWGIGPSKARDGGFGVEMVELIDTNQEMLTLLEKSRNLNL